MESFIKENGIIVSAVVISGDLGFSGAPDEYKTAKMKLQSFFNNIFRDDQQVVIIPGNHDYSCNTVFLDKYNGGSVVMQNNSSIIDRMQSLPKSTPCPEQDKNNQLLKGFSSQMVVTPDDFQEFEATEISRFYFNQCCYQLTNNDSYWETPLFIKNTSCRNVGLDIVGVENAAIFSNNRTNQRYRFGSDYGNMSITTGLLSILVGHASPQALGYKRVCEITGDRKLCNNNKCMETEICKKWESMRVLLSKTKSIIYLYGHKHFADYAMALDDSCLFLGTGAPNKINKLECSFSILKITQNQECNLHTNYTIYSWGTGEAKVNTSKNFLYDFGKQKWFEDGSKLNYQKEQNSQLTSNT